jgi:hypothetical protein
MAFALIWSKLKLFLKKYWILFVSGILGVLSLLAWLLTRPSKKTKPVKVVVEDKVEETHRKIAEVEAETAIEIGRAQGKEEAVKEEVEEIRREPSSRKRRERLAALMARSRRQR